jgi:hypothetical protein
MTRRSHHVDHRGSSYTRRKRRKKVIKVYGVKGIVRCHWCNVGMRTKFTIDRLNPKGTYRWSNIVPACESCNKGRRREKKHDD